MGKSKDVKNEGNPFDLDKKRAELQKLLDERWAAALRENAQASEQASKSGQRKKPRKPE